MVSVVRESIVVDAPSASITAGESSWNPPTSSKVMVTVLPSNPPGIRSEEHTSELQSLMRISYAVFCLKKKKKNITKIQHSQQPYRTQYRHTDNTHNHQHTKQTAPH